MYFYHACLRSGKDKDAEMHLENAATVSDWLGNHQSIAGQRERLLVDYPE